MSRRAIRTEQRGIDRTLVVRLLALFVGVVIVIITFVSFAAANSVSVPKDFPATVSMPASSHIVSADKTDANWQVEAQVDGEQGQKAALDALTEKGFVVTGSSGDTAADRIYSLSNGSYSVRLGFEQGDGNYLVTYGVAERQGGKK